MSQLRWLALVFLAAGLAACGDDSQPATDGGGDDVADGDGESSADGDADADADADGDAGVECEGPPAPGVLSDRVPPGAWPDLEWEDPFPGGWTTVDVTTRGVAPGAGDVSGALQSLIDGLDGPTILTFPAGAYELRAPVEMRSGLILRGAGSDATRFSLVDTNQAFTWQGVGGQWAWPWIAPEFGPRELQADVPVNDDTIPLADTSELDPGDIVMVAEAIENPSFPSAKYARGGIFALTAVTPTSVTVDLPLTVGLHRVNGLGEATVLSKLQPIGNGGIEHLSLVSPALTGYEMGGVLDLYLADNVFLRDVTSINAFGADVRISNSRRVLVTDSFFDRTQGSAPDGGESIWIDQLVTRTAVVNNILREKHPQLMVQVGGNLVVYAYNFHVDRLADYCHATDDPNCRDLDWIRDPELNGIARGWHGLADVVFHGNFPHHYLLEGNVFYNAVFDYHHFEQGPGTTLFRNRILGNPDDLTWWMNDYGVWLDGPHHGQNLVGNLLLHDSIITYHLHNGPAEPTDMFVAANTRSGTLDWGDLPPDSPLPPSLYRSCPPPFWTDDLPWPPFGPDVAGSATNRIPAQVRYEALAAGEP